MKKNSVSASLRSIKKTIFSDIFPFACCLSEGGLWLHHLKDTEKVQGPPEAHKMVAVHESVQVVNAI